MKRLQFGPRLVAVVFFSLLGICVAGSRAPAQEVVASYADNVGSIISYRIADGVQVARVQQVYRVNGVTYLPTRIAVEDSSSFYVVFGNRFLARLRATDGAILWVVDAGVTIGYTTYIVADIAVAGGSVFASNLEPGGRIARYRASDGALIWSVQRAVQVGSLRHLPLKLSATGTDSFFAVLGSQFLCKLSQRDGAVIWQAIIPLIYNPVPQLPPTPFVDPPGIADLTVGGGFAYVAYIDQRGTVRKFNPVGALVWQTSSLYRVGLIWYIPTKLAAVGSDPVMVLFGDRYLARMRAADGQILWTKDISLPMGYFSSSPSDIAAIGSP